MTIVSGCASICPLVFKIPRGRSRELMSVVIYLFFKISPIGSHLCNTFVSCLSFNDKKESKKRRCYAIV